MGASCMPRWRGPVSPEVASLYLSGQDKQRGGIDPGGGDRGYGVGSAGPGRYQRHAEAAGVLGIGVGGYRRGLLVQIAYRLQPGLPAE